MTLTTLTTPKPFVGVAKSSLQRRERVSKPSLSRGLPPPLSSLLSSFGRSHRLCRRLCRYLLCCHRRSLDRAPTPRHAACRRPRQRAVWEATTANARDLRRKKRVSATMREAKRHCGTTLQHCRADDIFDDYDDYDDHNGCDPAMDKGVWASVVVTKEKKAPASASACIAASVGVSASVGASASAAVG